MTLPTFDGKFNHPRRSLLPYFGPNFSMKMTRNLTCQMIFSISFMFYLQGVALTKVPKINFLVIIGGAKLKEPSLAGKAYSCLIHCPSVHFLGTSTGSCWFFFASDVIGKFFNVASLFTEAMRRNQVANRRSLLSFF